MNHYGWRIIVCFKFMLNFKCEFCVKYQRKTNSNVIPNVIKINANNTISVKLNLERNKIMNEPNY